MSSANHVVREVTVEQRQVAGVRAKVRKGYVGMEFGPYLNQVYAAGKAGQVALDGQNVFIYRSATETELTCDFCVGVTAPFAAIGNVAPLETPGGQAAMTTLVGPYTGIAAANAAIVEWCRTNNRVCAGPSWEVYGHWSNNPAELTTEIYYLLEPIGC